MSMHGCIKKLTSLGAIKSCHSYRSIFIVRSCVTRVSRIRNSCFALLWSLYLLQMVTFADAFPTGFCRFPVLIHKVMPKAPSWGPHIFQSDGKHNDIVDGVTCVWHSMRNANSHRILWPFLEIIHIIQQLLELSVNLILCPDNAWKNVVACARPLSSHHSLSSLVEFYEVSRRCNLNLPDIAKLPLH